MTFSPFTLHLARRPPLPLTVIRTRAQCETLARDATSFGAAGPGTVTLDLPIDPMVQATYQANINRFIGACGCAESGLVMLACLVSSLIGLWWLGLGQSLGLRAWVLNLDAFLLSAFVGLLVKLVILHNARRRLRDALLQLAALCAPA